MKSKLHSLQNRKAAITKALRALNDAAEKDARDFSEAEKAEFESLSAELNDVDSRLAREQRILDAEQALSSYLDDDDPLPTKDQQDQAQRGFASLGEFLQATVRVANGDYDERLIPRSSTGLNENVASDGGFLVGTDYAADLMERVYENTQALSGVGGASGAARIPISAGSNSVKIKALAETSRAAGSRWGGVRAYWKEEGGQMNASDPSWREITLSLKKLTGMAYATDELLQDAAALEATLSNAFEQEFAFAIQDAIVNGTGAGQPLGILNSGCLVSVSKETGQAAATLVAENVQKMYARMWPRSVPNSMWWINQECWPQLFNLAMPVGTGGVPLFQPAGGMSQAPFGTLLGRPIVPIEQCQALGTKGDIYFVDMSQYIFCDKGGIQAASSIHVKFDYNETAFRFTYRCDGQPGWNSALTPYKGTSSTQSPFISLNTRA